MSDTEAFSEELLKQLNCEIVFTIPVLDGIPVYESVVVGWIVMAILTVSAILLTRNLKVEPAGKRQVVVELAVNGLYNMFAGIVGEKGKKYVPYLITVMLFLVASNMIGLIGFKPPAKDLNTTAALAIMSILLIECAGIRENGVGGWLRHFKEPMIIVAPLNVMEVFIRPLSLCMRLFGNILGGFVVMELIKMVLPVLLPIPFSLYFDFFDGALQAYVFVFLTSLFLKESLDH